MERKMLINAVHSEEIRIAIVEDGRLSELEVESNLGKKLKGNIYKARISRLEPSLQAAFVDIGTNRNGFLQINDIHPSYFRSDYKPRRGNKIAIQDVLEAGQELIVQVVKEERNLKGATLTTYLSLPGRYIVLMPGSDRGGVSRKINDGDQRGRLRKLCRELEMPNGMGLIVRTAGLDRSQSELSRDLNNQLKLWERILIDAQTANSPSTLYQETDVATRVIRDYFTPEVREIIIDDASAHSRVKDFVEQVMPRYRSRVKYYDAPQPLFSQYDIDDQVADTMKPEVKLKSGGAIVIDTLEALVAIDVNSGKATTGEGIEETAYRTNLEAAEEIARQLRLRDLGGLIVIDFIDMLERKHKQDVEDALADAVKLDKARIELGRLSRFGLVEMSRQRLRGSLSSQSNIRCSQCQGTGKIKNPEVVALEALRKIQAAVVVGHVSLVKCRIAPSPALFLLNNKKAELARLEKEYSVNIYILADGRLRPDEVQFEMETARDLMDDDRDDDLENDSQDNRPAKSASNDGGGRSRDRRRSRGRRKPTQNGSSEADSSDNEAIDSSDDLEDDLPEPLTVSSESEPL